MIQILLSRLFRVLSLRLDWWLLFSPVKVVFLKKIGWLYLFITGIKSPFRLNQTELLCLMRLSTKWSSDNFDCLICVYHTDLWFLTFFWLSSDWKWWWNGRCSQLTCSRIIACIAIPGFSSIRYLKFLLQSIFLYNHIWVEGEVGPALRISYFFAIGISIVYHLVLLLKMIYE